ncbi:MAG: hypothetical protein LBU69_02255 [Deltaproteobacteria bacterium]|nr:hypothetical protein [Deltaproteobacteria bacterium]
MPIGPPEAGESPSLIQGYRTFRCLSSKATAYQQPGLKAASVFSWRPSPNLLD